MKNKKQNKQRIPVVILVLIALSYLISIGSYIERSRKISRISMEKDSMVIANAYLESDLCLANRGQYALKLIEEYKYWNAEQVDTVSYRRDVMPFNRYSYEVNFLYKHREQKGLITIIDTVNINGIHAVTIHVFKLHAKQPTLEGFKVWLRYVYKPDVHLGQTSYPIPAWTNIPHDTVYAVFLPIIWPDTKVDTPEYLKEIDEAIKNWP